MTAEVFANQATTTVASGGTDAPASGTQETWTVAASSAFPAAVAGVTQFHVADTAPGSISEIIAVTNVSGTTWTVTRGAESTTPVAHSAGFTIQQAVTAGVLGALSGLAPSGDSSGATDTAAIQGLLTPAGLVALQAGTFWIDQTLQIPSDCMLRGAGMGVTTVKAVNGYAAGQVGSNPGMVMICTVGNSSASHITISNLTLDMNEANIASLPAYASGDAAQCSPLGIWNVTGLTIDRVEVVSALGYSIYPAGCTDVKVRGCRVISGQASTDVGANQDGIHVQDCAGAVVAGNYIDTGTSANGGDDAIAVQAVSSAVSDVAITGNVVARSAAHGIGIYLGAGPSITGLAITGNVITNTQVQGIFLSMASYVNNAAHLVTDVSVSGNTFQGIAASGSGSGITLADGTGVGHTGLGAWKDVSITGNIFNGFTNTGGFGIYAVSGSVLQIEGNTFDNWDCLHGIRLGDNTGGTSQAVAGAQVVGNTLNMATTTATSPKGIMMADSSDGVITGNTTIGPGTAVSGGIGINVNGLGAAPLATTITGNRVRAWATGIGETNNGAQPDYTLIVGNNCHGNAAFITTSGANDVVASNVVA